MKNISQDLFISDQIGLDDLTKKYQHLSMQMNKKQTMANLGNLNATQQVESNESNSNNSKNVFADEKSQMVENGGGEFGFNSNGDGDNSNTNDFNQDESRIRSKVDAIKQRERKFTVTTVEESLISNNFPKKV